MLWKLRSVIIASAICNDYLISESVFENIRRDDMNLYPPSYFSYFDTYGRRCFVLTLRGDALFMEKKSLNSNDFQLMILPDFPDMRKPDTDEYAGFHNK